MTIVRKSSIPVIFFLLSITFLGVLALLRGKTGENQTLSQHDTIRDVSARNFAIRSETRHRGPLPSQRQDSEKHDDGSLDTDKATPAEILAKDHSGDAPELGVRGEVNHEEVEFPAKDLPTEATATPQTSRELVLINSANAGIEVWYLIDGKEYVLHSGESCELDGDGPWQVKFHRGGDFGDAERDLAPGFYEFTVSDRGWDLVETTNATSIDR
jgi:hypothetical protein